MIKNYLKIAIRNLLAHKTFSLINILGLSLGIACTIIIFLFVKYELTYDSYHPDSDRIYRVSRLLKRQNSEEGFAAIPIPCGPTLRDIYPEIESMFRINKGRMSQFRTDNNRFMEDDFHYVDSSIFEILYLPLIEGDPSSALIRPYTAILSEKASEKYFGKENPIGKTFMVDTFLYEVTGIMKNIPGNTHLKFNILFSWSSYDISYPRPHDWPSAWALGNMCTYIKLIDGADPDAFESKISDLVHRYDGENLASRGVEVSLFLQKINSIHLNSNLIWEPSPPGNKLYIFIFSGIGLLIILIACLNFMNLSTAKYLNRTMEVGIRKTVGASRRSLIKQFYGESLLIAFISHIIAMIITELSLPLFNDLFGLELTINYLDHIFIFGIIIIIIFVGLLAGTYPALYLSSFKPIKVLNSVSDPRSGGMVMRRILVVCQFAISIFLISNTIMLFKQLNYMKNQDLGFKKENKLILRFADEVIMPNNFETIKSEFLTVPGVLGATATSSAPGKWMYLWRTYPTNKEVENTKYINYFQHDFDFFDEFGLEIIAGRGFSRERGYDSYNRGYIINEAAYKTFGIESAEEALEAKFHSRGEPVLGVVKDFHIKGLQEKIAPLFMFIMQEDYKFISLSISDSDPIATKKAVEKKFNELFPEEVPRCSFLDEDFNSQYQKEERLGKLFSVFTLLGIIIACLGLFGMSSYMAEHRKKEIGIRKVNGASVGKIVVLLSVDFIKWVLLAIIIASPIIYLILNNWLKSFAYSAKIDIWVYIISGAMALTISLITISYQAFKAANANPVDSLRYE